LRSDTLPQHIHDVDDVAASRLCGFGVRAFQRHSVDLVVFGNRLAVDAIDLTALDAIARRAVGHVKANLAVF
jgi:hypothetical protein